MTQIPLLAGIVTGEGADYAVSYPINLEPVPSDNGISKGYLRTAMGASVFTTGPGTDRGGIVWNGTHYRVMATKLVSVDAVGNVTTLADVGGTGPVRLDYGFGRLAIASGQNLFYWDGTTLTQVTNSYLGPVLDMVWMDGYYVTTDGNSIIVTDLADPTNVNPLKYGSAEADPDMVVGLGRLRNELYAFGQNTIETYTDQGGSGFPFQVSEGATITKGCVGPFAKTTFLQSFAFVGGGRNESNAVWLMDGGKGEKLSTREVDDALAADPAIANCQIEVRSSRDENRLYIHLTNETWVYMPSASSRVQQPVWYRARSGLNMNEPYRLRNAVLANGQWICGDTQTPNLGVLGDAGPSGERSAFFSWTRDGETYSQERSLALGEAGSRMRRAQWRPHVRMDGPQIGLRFRGTNAQTQLGEACGWSFDTQFLYNGGRDAILHDVELIGLPGREVYGIAACEARVEALT